MRNPGDEHGIPGLPPPQYLRWSGSGVNRVTRKQQRKPGAPDKGKVQGGQGSAADPRSPHLGKVAALIRTLLPTEQREAPGVSRLAREEGGNQKINQTPPPGFLQTPFVLRGGRRGSGARGSNMAPAPRSRDPSPANNHHQPLTVTNGPPAPVFPSRTGFMLAGLKRALPKSHLEPRRGFAVTGPHVPCCWSSPWSRPAGNARPARLCPCTAPCTPGT